MRRPDGERGTWWAFSGARQDGDTRLALEFTDDATGLRATLRYEAVPGTDVLLRWTELAHTGTEPLHLERLDSAAVNVPVQGGARLTYLAGQWSQEFGRTQLDLVRGRFEMGSTQGVPGHAYAPWLAVQDAALPDGAGTPTYGVALEWPGNWHLTADAEPGGLLRVRAGRVPHEGAVRLRPGATLTTPQARLRLQRRGARRPVPGLAPLRTAAGGRAAAPAPARCSTTRGRPPASTWKPPTSSNWPPSPPTWAWSCSSSTTAGSPAGTTRRAASATGSPTRRHSRPASTPSSPTSARSAWTSACGSNPRRSAPSPGSTPNTPSGSTASTAARPRSCANSSCSTSAAPTSRTSSSATLDRLLTDHAVGYLKWDMNRPPTERGRPGAAPAGDLDLDAAHVAGYLRVLDHLRARHPHVTVEGCAGGGGRIEHATLARTDVVWPSDNTAPLDRLAIQYGYLHAHAPHTMSSWVTDAPGVFDPRPRSLAFRFVLAAAGVLGIGADLRAWDADRRAEAARWVARYKEVRDVVHHGEARLIGGPGDATCAVQYDEDGGPRTVVAAWSTGRLDGAPLVPGRAARLRLRGLDPAARYTDQETGTVYSGAHLLHSGLPLSWSADHDAELVVLARQ